jgi:hypothetical protein
VNIVYNHSLRVKCNYVIDFITLFIAAILRIRSIMSNRLAWVAKRARRAGLRPLALGCILSPRQLRDRRMGKQPAVCGRHSRGTPPPLAGSKDPKTGPVPHINIPKNFGVKWCDAATAPE